jgi:hypothetical protein
MFKDYETNGRNSLELNGAASTSSSSSSSSSSTGSSSNSSNNNVQTTESLIQSCLQQQQQQQQQQHDLQKQPQFIINNASQPFPLSHSLTKPYATSFIYAPHCYNLNSTNNATSVNTQVQQHSAASSSTPPFPTVRFNQHFSASLSSSSSSAATTAAATTTTTTTNNKQPSSSTAHSNAQDLDIYAYASSSSSSGGGSGGALACGSQINNLLTAIPQIDTSSYSMHTSSSCSTTPNSHYSHAGGGNGSGYINGSNGNGNNKYQLLVSNDAKLDTDIGSACRKCDRF